MEVAVRFCDDDEEDAPTEWQVAAEVDLFTQEADEEDFTADRDVVALIFPLDSG